MPNLKYKLLSSESGIKKLTYQNKQFKTEQLLNHFLLKIPEAKIIKISVLYGLLVEKFNLLLTCLLCYRISKMYGQWDSGH